MIMPGAQQKEAALGRTALFNLPGLNLCAFKINFTDG